MLLDDNFVQKGFNIIILSVLVKYMIILMFVLKLKDAHSVVMGTKPTHFTIINTFSSTSFVFFLFMYNFKLKISDNVWYRYTDFYLFFH
jgi:hypothetical protein